MSTQQGMLNAIAKAYRAILLNRLVDPDQDAQLALSQVYEAAVADYVDGSPPLVIQIIPGDVAPAGGGDGAQDGGGLVRGVRVTLCVFRRMLYDQRQRSAEALTRSSQGILDLFDAIRAIFALTTFGGLLAEPVKYAGETVTQWENVDKGILRREISFMNVFALVLPVAATTTDDDLVLPE